MRGRVVDATGAPVKDIGVGWMSGGGGLGRRGSPGEFHKVATTDSRGLYAVNLLPPGPCRMVAGRFLSFFQTPAPIDGLPTTAVLRLRQDATIEAPDLRLPVDPRILGTLEVLVVDPSGRPVRGAGVHCSNLVSPWGDPSADSKTDSKGRLRIQGVNPGEVTVSVSRTARLGDSHQMTWLPPGTRQRIRVVLPKVHRERRARRRIRVVCRDDTGRPLRGCRVHVYGFATKSGSVEGISGSGGVAILQGYLRKEQRGSLSGSAWNYPFESARFQVDVRRGGRTSRSEAVLRRTVNIVFKIVDASTNAIVGRTSLKIAPSGGGGSSRSMSLGMIRADPAGPSRFLFLPSERLPLGRVNVVIASPGYAPKVLSLQVRPRKGNRVLLARLEPAK